MEVDMARIKLTNEDNDKLKKMYETIMTMKRPDYGMTEDDTFTAPVQCSKELVDKVQLQRESEVAEIHKDIALIQKLFLKVKRKIEKNQKTTFRLAVCRKRNRKYEDDERQRKRQRVEQIRETQKMGQEQSKIQRYDLVSLSCDDDVTDLDEFDLS
jgi:hypothetical protein